MFNFNISNSNNHNQLVKQDKLFDIIIIGGGPAGMNALLYAKRKGLDCLLIAKEIGGQLNNTDLIDNYLGIKDITGANLTSLFQNHINDYKDDVLLDKEVVSISKQGDTFYVALKDFSQYKSKTVILSTGGSPKKLEVPGELTYQAKGISYCTICDAPFFKDKDVVVVGGGNSAAESVIDLLKWAKHVTVIQRSKFRADKSLLDKFINHKDVTIYLDTKINQMLGNEKLTHIEVINKDLEIKTIKTDGVFVAVGVIPNSSLVKDLTLLNSHGEVIVDMNQKTSLEGLYAVGDVTNQPYKQIIIAAAEGAKAVLDIANYLNYKKEGK